MYRSGASRPCDQTIKPQPALAGFVIVAHEFIHPVQLLLLSLPQRPGNQ